ncbi:MAG: single-stranded DNA-binding protein [Porphyromonadaceae bacterium]|nr:single-stranded DNA-binding protein [Porphyromonadaceae bacterium]MCD8288207.1 single-stranded DNA-binding protein [Porphyromonadaceae bacterium]
MSVNKVILVGNVGKDPEVRYFDNNVARATFPLATTERGFTRQGGTQVPDHTEWHNIVLWRGLAEVAEKYVRKGSQLYIEGRIRTRSYEVEGATRYITEIYADNMQMLGRRSDQPGSVNEGNGGAAAGMSNASTVTPPTFTQNDVSDDLPF